MANGPTARQQLKITAHDATESRDDMVDWPILQMWRNGAPGGHMSVNQTE